MRRGYQIHLSGDPDDLVTVLVVLGRKDYGDLHLTGVVVDVGAHLGTFTLYALSQGARLVYAYEPDPVLYQYLIKNLSVNGLTGKVRPFEAAVVGSGPGQMAFLAEGNASGHIASSSDADTGAILVKTVTLADIVLANQIDYIDFLKLDCEGSEYGIIFDTPQEIWNRVGRVCLEYHYGNADKIKQRLSELGFILRGSKERTRMVGLLWFEMSRAHYAHAGTSVSRACGQS